MSGNHNSKSNYTKAFKWTVEDEAIHRGMNYAEYWEQDIKDLLKEGMSLHAILKNAYQEGFLHGFEHKFDNTNYEEKKDD